MNRQTKISQPGVNEKGEAVTIETKTEYNFEGKPVKITDANGNETKNTYNGRGLLEKIQNTVTVNGTSQTYTTLYAYDRAGRKTAEVQPENYDAKKTIEEMNRTDSQKKHI
jgi:YD repeat-containing protein